MSRRIDYYFSLVSPWTYIGHRLFLHIARRHGAGIAYRPVLLNEVFSQTGGLPLAKRHPPARPIACSNCSAAREAPIVVSFVARKLAL